LSVPLIFDRHRARLQRARYLARPDGQGFLRPEVIERVVERLADIKRPLDIVLDLGAGRGELGQTLAAAGMAPSLLIETDLAPSADHAAGRRIVVDEELLSFGKTSFDAAVSALALHRINDLPGVLAQLSACLKPGGFLLAALPGGDTLHELRFALAQAELAISDGAAARVHPSIDVRDLGALLQRAGYEMPMTDVDRLTVTYPHLAALLADLRGMGETSILAHAGRPRALSRRVLMEAEAVYRSTFGLPNGRLPATFDIVFAIGWKAR
jgi:NADH dehydrogenase [ubiquinone] 1 alpha subcomplex assembly factor 5